MNKTIFSSGLISCIIPVYNRPELIIECVQSVLAQTYSNYEIIIVDDGSTDKTATVISRLAQDHPEKIKTFRQKNQGPGAARQLGLEHATGEFVQFLDSDDLILPNKFELYNHAFESENKPDIVYSVTHYYKKDDPSNYVIWKQNESGKTSILPNFIVSRAWSTSTPIYKKFLLVEAGKILPLNCEEDLEYDCRIGLQNPNIVFINQYLTAFRDHSSQRFSTNNPNRAKQLANQIEARAHIYKTMRNFGLQNNSSEMKLFAQTLFLFARQAGELGMVEESKSAFNLARHAGGELSGKDKLAMTVYKITNSIAGPKAGSQLFSNIYNRLHKLKN